MADSRSRSSSFYRSGATGYGGTSFSPSPGDHRRTRNLSAGEEDGNPSSRPGSTTAFPRPPSSAAVSSASSAPAATERQPLLMRRTFSHELEPEPVFACVPNPHTHLPVYTNIHRIRRDIVAVVEDYLSPDQLRDVRINLSVVRPLVDKLYELDDISIVYCLLVNRAQFLHEQSYLNNRQNVNFTRAALCEIVAHRILRRFNEDNEGLEGLLVLSHILIAGFEPFQNAPDSVRSEATESGLWLYRRALPALEVAILSESKLFLSSTACQKVIDAIYVGRVTYTPSSFLDLIPDRYKQKPIALYDPREASLLNQYRLIVPRTRNILEFCQFVILLALYMVFMAERDASRFSKLEVAFCIFSFGWALDQFATILEHGWHVYTQNLWSFLDVTYSVIYLSYGFLRLHGWRTHSLDYGQQALDALAIGAPVLIPRIAFTVMSDNLLFVSLRSMMADFTLLTFLVGWCFGGFLLSLAWLGEGEYPTLTIGKWMVYIWFGLDGTGIQKSTDFHWLLGPSLMIAFAFLGNTLFLTVLVSMLSNTFSTIVSNATAEIQFRRAVLTLQGVKSDAIFAYQPPFNILAMFFLVPLKFLVSPRWFHKIHVACVRTINLPVLLIIAVMERRLLWASSPYGETYARRMPLGPARRSFWEKWRFTTHSDIQSVFELPPPDSVEDEINADDDLTRHLIRRQFVRAQTTDSIAAVLANFNKNNNAKNNDDGNGNSSNEVASANGAGSGGVVFVTGGSVSINGDATVMSSSLKETTTNTGTAEADEAQQQPKPGGAVLKKSGSSVKFADMRTDGRGGSTGSMGGARTPRSAYKQSTSRRDSIAFPGLDPGKLRSVLKQQDGNNDENDGEDDDGAGDAANYNNRNTGRAVAQLSSRMESLEESVARVESMLNRMLGLSGGDSHSQSHSSSRGRRSRSEDVDTEAAHDAADDVIDDSDMGNAERTGSLGDLDMTADER